MTQSGMHANHQRYCCFLFFLFAFFGDVKVADLLSSCGAAVRVRNQVGVLGRIWILHVRLLGERLDVL